jgi:hypothetical protein
MAFKNAYDAAQAVIADYQASQFSIDAAAEDLQTAYNNLDGHPFIGAETAQFFVNGLAYIENKDYSKDANNQMVVSATVSEDAMITSAELTFDEASLTA